MQCTRRYTYSYSYVPHREWWGVVLTDYKPVLHLIFSSILSESRFISFASLISGCFQLSCHITQMCLYEAFSSQIGAFFVFSEYGFFVEWLTNFKKLFDVLDILIVSTHEYVLVSIYRLEFILSTMCCILIVLYSSKTIRSNIYFIHLD